MTIIQRPTCPMPHTLKASSALSASTVSNSEMASATSCGSRASSHLCTGQTTATANSDSATGAKTERAK